MLRWAAIGAEGGAAARQQEQEGAARVAHDIAQRIDAVIAAPVRHHQRLVVVHADKAGLVAARRTIHAFGANRGKGGERAGLDQAPVMRRHAVAHLDGGGRNRGGGIDLLKLIERGDDAHDVAFDSAHAGVMNLPAVSGL